MSSEITKDQLAELKRLQKREKSEKARRKKYSEAYRKRLSDARMTRTTVAVFEEELEEIQRLEAMGYQRKLIVVPKAEADMMRGKVTITELHSEHK